ncbi:MAG: cardiolipin synthase B [Acidobacteria bacterium]|nr:cardiolipin synthase B [Acidobacteriota bacterium]
MQELETRQTDKKTSSRTRLMSERAQMRTAGAPLLAGNSVRILKDSTENYPAWLEAIKSAQRRIYFESYIIHEDEWGKVFADALMERARAGVIVRVIYDWMGAINAASLGFWQRMRRAGVDVRCFNPPRFDSPFGWFSRDHRKMIAVDGRVGYIAGLCVGKMWVGDPERGIDPWRDTGVEVMGPAVREIEQSFARMWMLAGAPLPDDEMTYPENVRTGDDISVRVIASEPNTAALYRLDQMVAAGSRKYFWLTDAYFAGTTPYVQALRAASLDGVDVRLLVPQATDIPVVRALSRSGYRPLLEAGVRVFEWNGQMLHAKTAVSDGKWARIGSTNLNLVSWITNYELDLVIENESIGRAMEDIYLQDLKNATEIVLTARMKPSPLIKRNNKNLRERIGGGSSGKAAASAIRLGNTIGAAITNRRVLGPAEAKIMASSGFLLLGLAALAIFYPRVITLPLAFIGLWLAGSLFFRAFFLHREGIKEHRALMEELKNQSPDEESSR